MECDFRSGTLDLDNCEFGMLHTYDCRDRFVPERRRFSIRRIGRIGDWMKGSYYNAIRMFLTDKYGENLSRWNGCYQLYDI
jgi:hypothetical protein